MGGGRVPQSSRPTQDGVSGQVSASATRFLGCLRPPQCMQAATTTRSGGASGAQAKLCPVIVCRKNGPPLESRGPKVRQHSLGCRASSGADQPPPKALVVQSFSLLIFTPSKGFSVAAPRMQPCSVQLSRPPTHTHLQVPPCRCSLGRLAWLLLSVHQQVKPTALGFGSHAGLRPFIACCASTRLQEPPTSHFRHPAYMFKVALVHPY